MPDSGARPADGRGKVRLARARSANQHDVLRKFCRADELAIGAGSMLFVILTPPVFLSAVLTTTTTLLPGRA